MKIQLKIAVYAIAMLSAVGLGAINEALHRDKIAAHLDQACPVQPLLEPCVERARAKAQVRYFFNGQELSRHSVLAQQ